MYFFRRRSPKGASKFLKNGFPGEDIRKKITLSPNFFKYICYSPYGNDFIMRTGTPRMRIPSGPCPYAYGVPHMHTAIPICIFLHMGVKSLISHMRTNTLCIRLVTDQSPYAYRVLKNPRTHTGIHLQSITIRVRDFRQSPYAYGDCNLMCF